jgi:hypothetical protein
MKAYSPAPALPGFAQNKTYAAHRCWKDSTPAKVKFHPLSKKDAVKIFHHARRFERATAISRQDAFGKISTQGRIGRMGILALHTLLFDFLNYKSGRLDPSIRAIAERACISVRSVYRALARLRDAGILSWVQRCSASLVDGHYTREQETNAYGLSPPGQWRGYRPPADPPPPYPDTVGAPPKLGGLGLQPGDGIQRTQIVLEGGGTPLSDALAELGRRRRS